MKRKILAVILSIIFIFTQTALVEAKGSVSKSSGSSSSSRSISKSSGGYSGSSSSKSSGGSSSSSKSSGGSSSSSKSSGGSSSSTGGYSGSSSSSSGSSGSSSSSRSVPGSYSGSSSSKSSGSTGSSSSGSTGSSSSSKSSGSTSGSGSSSGTSGSTGSSSSGYTGGSSSSKSSGSTGGTTGSSSSSKSSSSTVKSKTDTLKNTYMQETYKKQASQNNYSAYKQKLNDEQKKTYESSFNNTYGSGSRMDFDSAMRTRPQRISDYSTRPIRININTYQFGGPFSYGYAFAGPWDLWFLMRASDMFWYHHWNDIYPYRDYFEAAQFAQMEQRIRALEAQNIPRDATYMEPGVDPDLQLSSDYLEKNVDKYYYTNQYAKPVKNPVGTLIGVVIIIAGLVLILRHFSRRRPKNPYGGGGIY